MNTEKDKIQDTSEKLVINLLIKVGFAVFSCAILILYVFIFNFRNQEISQNISDWAAFGDYIGGLLNPIVGMATILLVILSIRIQQKELKASVREMKSANETSYRISFEQSMFSWLENYHKQIREIKHGNYEGRMFLQHLYGERLSPAKTVTLESDCIKLDKIFYPRSDSEGNEIYIRINVPNEYGLHQMSARQFYATIQFQEIYGKYRSDFDAAFRTLYRLIRWVDKSQISLSDKWHYCALIRSQLSWIELVFLYYNGLIQEGEKLAFYANKYALFDNLASSDLLITWAANELTNLPKENHPKIRDGNALWPYEKEAFKSSLAKIKLGLPSDS